MSIQIAQLLVQMQGQVIQTVALSMPVLSIGRTPEGGLMLDHQSISRRHAELRQGPQGTLLTDLGSANGTFIGEQRLLPNQPHLLTDGTSFRIGPFLLLYRTSLVAAPEKDEPSLALPEQPTLPPILAAEQMTPRPAPRPLQIARRAPDHGLATLYTHYLPDIYQENDFLQRFLHIFEDVWEPLEQRQDHIELYFDPRTCPPAFLPWLASWLDIPLNQHWPETRQRDLLTQAMELYSWRGTSYGLARMIEVCTGLMPQISEKPNEPFVFHIRITLPPERRGEGVDRTLLEELIQIHKPAHAGYILEVL